MGKKPIEKEPPGGWLSPPPTNGIKPLAITRKSKKGQWLWEPIPQTRADRSRRADWEKRMAKADLNGRWRFKWKPEEE